MTVLHLGHQVTDLTGVSGLISTDAAGFDADLDSNCIKVTSDRANAVPITCEFAAPAGDLWYQERYVSPAASAGSIISGGQLLRFYDASDVEIAQIRTEAGTEAYHCAAIGDTSVLGSAAFVAANGTAYWLDVQVSVGANITVNLYVDGTLLGTATAANSGGKGKPVRVVIQNVNLHGSGGATFWYHAHIAVLDGVSTVGRRFARRRPSAAATHTDLIGAVADLADADDATRMGSAAAADRQSWTLTGPTGPGTGTIVAVHQKLRAQRGVSGPTKVGGSLRIGGTDYDATTQTAPADAPAALISTWTQNPATTSAWTSGTLPTEAGLLTAT
jgi:hypothetical protein